MKIKIKTIGSAEFEITEIEQVDFELDNGDTFEVMEGENESLWIESTDSGAPGGRRQLSTSPSAGGVLISLWR